MKFLRLGLIACMVCLGGCTLAQDDTLSTPVIVRVGDMTQVAESDPMPTLTAGPIVISSATSQSLGLTNTPENNAQPPTTTPTIAANPTITPTSFPDGLYDALPVMSGICFEAAFDAAGETFVLRNAEEHIRFYNLADNSGLCRRSITRQPFDFSQGDILAGLWSIGAGCVANHDILSVERNEAVQTITIMLKFVTEGDCPYELVRPFWVGIPDATGYTISIDVIEIN